MLHNHPKARARKILRYWGDGLQRLEVVIAVMLACERRRHADTAADGCTELAVALAALPSRPLEMVADALAARF
jgi:hypothetical protein